MTALGNNFHRTEKEIAKKENIRNGQYGILRARPDRDYRGGIHIEKSGKLHVPRFGDRHRRGDHCGSLSLLHGTTANRQIIRII